MLCCTEKTSPHRRLNTRTLYTLAAILVINIYLFSHIRVYNLGNKDLQQVAEYITASIHSLPLEQRPVLAADDLFTVKIVQVVSHRSFFQNPRFDIYYVLRRQEKSGRIYITHLTLRRALSSGNNLIIQETAKNAINPGN